jgi:hypothetical protein
MYRYVLGQLSVLGAVFMWLARREAEMGAILPSW